MNDVGYDVPNTKFVLQDVEKEEVICHHSEKLATLWEPQQSSSW
jgi:hypothetical protein